MILSNLFDFSRIAKETQRLLQDPVPGISATPDDNNARYFHVIIAGPQGSPFEVCAFSLLNYDFGEYY